MYGTNGCDILFLCTRRFAWICIGIIVIALLIICNDVVLQHIDDPEVLDSLASIDHSVTIKLVGGKDAPQTTVHRQGDKNTTILVQAADAMKKNVPNNNSGAVEQPTVNNTPPGDADKAKKARLKAERKAAFVSDSFLFFGTFVKAKAGSFLDLN